jgi:hypothetical protein
MPSHRYFAVAFAFTVLAGLLPSPAGAAQTLHYEHIFVIVAENLGAGRIIGNDAAPNINRLAKDHGLATQFYGEVHPSEGNYVAILGGDTFGIHDDDGFYCKPGMKADGCANSDRPDYVDHTVPAPSLVDQLAAHGFSWKGYFEDIPAPGSPVFRWPSLAEPVAGKPAELYALKHNGFMNFKSVQDDPGRAQKIVGFDVLAQDIATGRLPNYAHIIPNQCNDMHGLSKGPDIPADCTKTNLNALIARGDAAIGKVVNAIMASPLWSAPANSAIVITFDEDDHTQGAQGCCAYDPQSVANYGGGLIPTIVVTNHGPHGVTDPTPYNHYSLLRTTEEAFGITPYLAHAADTAAGVVTMTPLFATPK